MVWSLPIDSDPETKPNKSLPVVKNSITGRPSRDKYKYSLSIVKNVLPVVD